MLIACIVCKTQFEEPQKLQKQNRRCVDCRNENSHEAKARYARKYVGFLTYMGKENRNFQNPKYQFYRLHHSEYTKYDEKYYSDEKSINLENILP